MGNDRDQVRQLVADATAATAGGVRTVPERILQHRDLLLAVVCLMDKDDRFDGALQQLWTTLRLYPEHGPEHADPIRMRWGIKNADAFHAAIERLHQLCPSEV